ncbi:hypothetical protein ACSV5M_02650 [Cellvibrio sp. ARAG 10.3]|uniref:hypothetical protein n=1 Tax=Cellvibrio sp. ARAG 10.3 TaxID=3451358 RepID=UPI003F467F78
MATDIELKAEYAERSWNYELPDHLEQALEDDYVQNRLLYSEATFKCIQTLYLLNPEVTPQMLLKFVRAWSNLE